MSGLTWLFIALLGAMALVFLVALILSKDDGKGL
jgi:hypothetical protein